MTVKSFWAGAAISAAASAVVLSAAGQQTSVNPSFTAEQAEAGRPVFQTNCATSHGADLSGGPYAPPLAGRAFVDVWSKRSIRDLIESIRTMPPTTPRCSTTMHVSILPPTFCKRMASLQVRDA